MTLDAKLAVLTPRSIVGAIRAGFVPQVAKRPAAAGRSNLSFTEP